jgi:hypothetical protein
MLPASQSRVTYAAKTSRCLLFEVALDRSLACFTAKADGTTSWQLLTSFS